MRGILTSFDLKKEGNMKCNTSHLVTFVFLKYAIFLLLRMYFACYKLLFVMCQFAWTLSANVIRITVLFTVL
jgi:hypothetical protein